MDLKIVPAKFEDNQILTEFLHTFFFPEEPLNMALKRCTKPEDLDIIEYLKNGFSLKALNMLANSEDNLVGAVINKEVSLANKRDLSTIQDPKRYKIQKLLIELDEKSKLWEVVNNEEHFNILLLSVSKKFRGHGIGRKLLEESLKLAKSMNYKYVSIECSSYYSAKLAVDLGFELLGEILYADYLDENNQPVFKMSPPHTAVKKFIKKL